tara:strand:+ start:245 stop:1669 length:1425 start_codon:yes stop_codon:yes gene_type:complete
MNSNIKYIAYLFSLLNVLYCSFNEIQLITTHKKSNGTLLRIVTKNTMDIEDVAGWAGQENWFYLTFNKTSLSQKSMDYIVFEPPLMDLETTKNNESVQLGYLFERPIQDFEIFHSKASRVILVQVWDTLNDSLITEVESLEKDNGNLVFSLPPNEAKGSPFYDSFIYARDKYGPEKYFVWYNKWYSTDDASDGLASDESPKPLVIKNKVSLSESLFKPPQINDKAKRELAIRENVKTSPILSILDNGILLSGVNRPSKVKILQEALISLGYDLGLNGPFSNGVDGQYGKLTEEAVISFQMDRGFNGSEIDGIVGEATLKELIRALSGLSPLNAAIKSQEINQIENQSLYSSIDSETAEDILKKPPISTQVKRETRKLPNAQEITLLPPDLSKRKTFLKLSCNVEGANVYIDGSYMGKTPIKKLSVNPGWHRIRVIDPNTPRPQFAMRVPDYQDVYIPQGKSQKIRINLAISEEE